MWIVSISYDIWVPDGYLRVWLWLTSKPDKHTKQTRKFILFYTVVQDYLIVYVYPCITDVLCNTLHWISQVYLIRYVNLRFHFSICCVIRYLYLRFHSLFIFVIFSVVVLENAAFLHRPSTWILVAVLLVSYFS